MKFEEMANAAESTMRTAGFEISRRCSARPSCFCMAARNDKDLMLIKLSSDLGKISLRDAFELQTIASCFSATPILIAEKSRENCLEDDTVYARYDIYAATLKTLEDVFGKGTLPLVEAGPGGYYVRLDGDIIRSRRTKLGLSVGKLAERLRISRRTLYGYERGMAKASVSAAYNLEWILGVPVVKGIDIFKPAPPETGFFATAKRWIIRNRLLQRVLKRLIVCDFKVAATTRAPFDFIARAPVADLNIIGGVAHRTERNLDQRIEEMISLSDVLEAQPVFITDGNLTPQSDIPLISSNDLEQIQLAEDLISRL
jgi:putative transcriptional regulator